MVPKKLGNNGTEKFGILKCFKSKLNRCDHSAKSKQTSKTKNEKQRADNMIKYEVMLSELQTIYRFLIENIKYEL